MINNNIYITLGRKYWAEFLILKNIFLNKFVNENIILILSLKKIKIYIIFIILLILLKKIRMICYNFFFLFFFFVGMTFYNLKSITIIPIILIKTNSHKKNIVLNLQA